MNSVDRISPSDIESVYSLSPAQEGMLFHDLYGEGGGEYISQLHWRLRQLHVPTFQRAWKAVVHRHGALRTAFVWEQVNRPVQAVHRNVELEWQEEEWTGIDKEEQERRLEEYRRREFSRGFVLTRAPLMRMAILHLGSDEHEFIWTKHHALLDGWSGALVLEEVAKFYQAFVEGKHPELSTVRPYRDYISWLQRKDLADAEKYWRLALAGLREPTVLALSRAEKTRKYGECQLLLSEAEAEDLRKMSRKAGVTLNTLIQGAWAVLLSRYGGTQDVVFGAATSGRPPDLSGADRMIGLFINTLPVRVQLVPSRPVRDFLRELHRQQAKARQYEYAPLVSMQEWSELGRGTPLFDSIIVFENYPVNHSSGVLGPVILEAGTSDRTNYGLTLLVRPSGRAVLLDMLYDEGQYCSDHARQLVEHCRNLLLAMARSTADSLDSLEMMSEFERDQLLVDWNRTRETGEGADNLSQLLQSHCDDVIALEAGGLQLSYRDLHTRSDELALCLRELGVGPEVRVGVCLDRSVGLVVALLAVLKAGGAYVPLDATFPKQRLDFMLQDARVAVLVTQRETLSCLPACKAVVVDVEDICSGSRDLVIDPDARPDNLAYIIYTSGSTGTPKGVQITRRNLANFLNTMCFRSPLRASDRVLAVTTISFDIAALELFLPLLLGARVVISAAGAGADPQQLLAAGGITAMQATPATWQLLAESGWKGQRALKILSGGETLPADLAATLLERGAGLWNLYGPTETTIWSTLAKIESAAQLSVGKPIGNTRLYILDDSQKLVPVGVPGELWIAGDGVARGYVNRPELTADRFRPEPFGSTNGNRMYRTGDIARYDPTGNVQVLGRKDSQIKLRGHRIELGEIEAHLRSHAAVTEACVTARKGGQDDVRLVAYVACDKAYFSQRNRQRGDEARDVVQRWGEVWDQTYRQPNPTRDSTFNIQGWKRSDAESAIPESVMREWVGWTTRRILDLAPQRLLDIGCGTGLQLFPLAEHCEVYYGTDLSDAGLQHIRGQLPSTSNVTLLQRPAHDFSGFVLGQFDTVVFNSVVQYFPGTEYLLEVLDQAVRLVLPRGKIFIGDVRSLPLLEAFHSWCVASQAPPSLMVRECVNRARRRVFEERELALAPQFFHALQSRCSSISAVEVFLKRGSENELTRFRYDVVLHVGDQPREVVRPQVVDWCKEHLNLSMLRLMLTNSRPAVLQLRQIPNRRVKEALDRLHVWRESRPGASLAECELRMQELPSVDAVAPEALIEVARDLQYETELYCSADASGACFDAFFGDRESIGSDRPMPVAETIQWHDGALVEYANAPALSRATPDLRRELEILLRQSVPNYMLPSSYVFLDRLPRTPNGKWNLKDLPDEDGEAVARSVPAERALPQTPIEEILAGMWRELLRVGSVFRHDNFFQLGGHSLLATRLVSRVRDKFGVDLSLRQFFDNPTVIQLAELVETGLRAGLNLRLPPMEKISRAGDLPLSLAQERFWFLHQFDPADPAYNVCAAFVIDGPLDLQVLNSCFQELLQRHEVLRTTYPAFDGQAAARVADASNWALHVIDLEISNEPSQIPDAETSIRELASQPFDLATGPLFRAVLLRVRAQQSILFLNVHHIVTDEQSMRIMVRELVEFYGARMESRPAILMPLAFQYADFAAWQRSWLTDAVVQQQLQFWRAHLMGWSGRLHLPYDHYYPTRSNLGGSVCFNVSEEVTRRIRVISSEEGATLFMTLVAALQTLLYRYTGEEDLAIGAVIANRSRRETENLIGLFVNTVILRAKFQGNLDFSSLLKQVRETTLGVYTHQDLPFEMLVAGLYPDREAHSNPLFRVMFVFQERDDELHLPAVNITPIAASSERAKFELTVIVREHKRGIAVNLQFCRDLFEQSVVERIARHLQNLLGSIAEDPGQTVDSIMLGDDSDRRWLDKWICAEQSSVPESTLHELFDQQVREKPDAIALCCEDEQLTYAELNLRADQLARYLRHRGVGPDTRVGLCVEPSIAMIVGLLGILKAGGAYVPLDPAFPQERLEWMLSDSQAILLLTQRSVRNRCSLPVNYSVVLDNWEDIEEAATDLKPSPAAPENLAYVIYTSGSTGRPKGVAIEHRQIVNYVRAVSRNLSGARRFVMLSTFAADLGNTVLYPALCTGGTLYLMNRHQASEGNEAADFLTRHAIDCMKITPSHLILLLASGPMELPEWLVLGGEASTWKQLEVLKRLQPSGLLMNHYGPTECTVGALMSVIAPDALRFGKNVPLGLPLMNVQTYVLGRIGRQSPPGAIGELYIGGAGVARGYLNRPDLTAEKFVPDPFSGEPGSRLYRTGDKVRYLSNGSMEFLGRADEQIKIRGYRVEPEEVESMLRSHPDVEASAVKVGAEEDGGKRLVGYVVLRRREAVSSSELRAWLQARLPEYMVPSAVVTLERMPLTPNGKLDRRELPEPEWGSEKQLFAAPRNSLELRLVRLWEDLIGKKPIGVRDNFFDVGGHSLLAARLTARIKREFGVALPLASLFERPTVEGIVSLLRASHANSLSQLLVRIHKGESSVSWFWMHPVGGAVLCYRELAQHLGETQSVYGLQAAGLEDDQPPSRTIPEMASRYVSEIRAEQPNGPYLIGGASMGGAVAFEVARQLVSMDETVALLAILDGHPGGLGDPDGLETMDEADMILWLLRATDPVLAEELAQFQGDERVRRAIGILHHTSILFPEADVAAARSLLRLHRANKLAFDYYQAREYSGSIALFRAAEGLSSDVRPLNLGWDRFAAGGVEVQVVPGSHVSMLDEPNVAVIGNHLQDMAEEALKPNLLSRC